MERRYPREFSRPEVQFNQQINIQSGTPVDHPVHMIPQSELLELAELTREIEAEILLSDTGERV
jgi:hypothetical protein